MKTIEAERSSLDQCIRDAQGGRIVLTRGGVPVAMVVGLEGLDAEQVELGSDPEFWRLIDERRAQPTCGREELERRLEG